jgi:hypothetical protein
MKVRTSIIAAGAAVVLGTTGALVLPAVASAHSTTTTLKFISVEKASAGFSKTAGGQQDTDVNAKGKTAGAAGWLNGSVFSQAKNAAR